MDLVAESTVSIHEGLSQCPTDVVEHVAFLLSEAALVVANSLRCDRLAIQEAVASLEAGSEAEDEDEVGQASVAASLPSPGDSLSASEGSPRKRSRSEKPLTAVGSPSELSHAAERQDGNRSPEGRAHLSPSSGDEGRKQARGSRKDGR